MSKNKKKKKVHRGNKYKVFSKKAETIKKMQADEEKVISKDEAPKVVE